MRRRTTGRTRAQVMVLGAVTMLVMALMLMLSFNLTQAIHEKIRLQSHSDSMAYSMATVEARAMNYFAYSNRAIAAVSVSIMTLHAYYSQMILTAQAFQAAWIAFAEIAGMEAAEIALCCPACCVQHIPDLIRAGIVAVQFYRQQNDYNRRIRGMEQNFNRAVQAYSIFLDVIWGTQQAVILYTADTLRGANLDSLHAINAPCASQLPLTIAALNVRQFACAMEGSPIDVLCLAGQAVSPVDARSRVMANVANAARGEWPKDRTIPFPALWHPQMLRDLMTGVQGQGVTVPIITGGSAKAIQSTSSGECTGNQANRTGATICGVDEGSLLSFFIDTPPGWAPFSSGIYSNDNGGAHSGGGHTGRHGEWHGFQPFDNPIRCITRGECFINFRSNPAVRDDYGQPKVYGYFSQDLRFNTHCQRGPWELGTNGRLAIGDGARGNGVLDFGPTDPASAVSKAMVYYHRPDDWRMPPTTFDPYWKAKLHPFTSREAATVLGVALDATGAGMALGGPVEGVDPP